MRKIKRRPLSAHANTVLAGRQTLVASHPDPKARAHKLWQQRNNKAFREIREVLSEMATGRNRCMYCEDSEGTDIEHFYPKSSYPDRAYLWDNYLLACSKCNSNYKRSQFPLRRNRKPMLIDPTKENPATHLTFTPTTGSFFGKTSRGRRSITIYGLDRGTLRQGRHDTWISLCNLIPRYADYMRRGELEEARKIRNMIRRFPFSFVFWHLVRISRLPGAHEVLPEDLRAALADFPRILRW